VRTPKPDRKLGPVQRRLRVTIELDPDSEPIRGIISDEDAARSFTGWMELVTALQAAIDRHADHTETRNQDEDR
jgi:hypothetical protein